MKLYLLNLIALILPLGAIAQFEIAHTSIQLTDTDRSKSIPVEVYYPSSLAGEDQPIIEDSLPLIVVAHGFVIAVNDYSYIWEYLVPKGYVVCLPNTETGISPNHEDFAFDINFTAENIALEFTDGNSVLYGAYHQRTGYIGHSMGGGAAHLAATHPSNVQALISLAAAETTPSAIVASNSISIPTLVFSGEQDCVAPSADHQSPMYSAVNSPCKTYINILGGGHCHFADDNFICGLGEQSCGGSPSTDRTVQQAIVLNYMGQWLDKVLKENTINVDLEGLTEDTQVNYESTCSALSVEQMNPYNLQVIPNPANDFIYLTGNINFEITASLYDIKGRLLYTKIVNTDQPLNIQFLERGVYIVQVKGENTWFSQEVIKQ